MALATTIKEIATLSVESWSAFTTMSPES